MVKGTISSTYSQMVQKRKWKREGGRERENMKMIKLENRGKRKQCGRFC